MTKFVGEWQNVIGGNIDAELKQVNDLTGMVVGRSETAGLDDLGANRVL